MSESQQILEKLLLENLKEQKRKRRWGIFFKLIYLFILLFILGSLIFGSYFLSDGNPHKPHTALVDIQGVISNNGDNEADLIVKSITNAYKDDNAKAIILRINSPGGSPVVASDIYTNIMRLRKKYPEKKIYAVCQDACASAAYYIASATDDIYANQSSIVGSIGVLMNGFGFVGTMQKLGIERRLIKSGSEKGFLDPFSPLQQQDLQYAEKMLDIVHQQFIQAVKQGRGKRLKTDDPLIFSGLAWTGEQAKQLGLIDGFGSAGYVARNIIKNTNVVNYTEKPPLLQQVSQGIGASFAREFEAIFAWGGKLR